MIITLGKVSIQRNGCTGRSYEWIVESYAENLGYFKVIQSSLQVKAELNDKTCATEASPLRYQRTRDKKVIAVQLVNWLDSVSITGICPIRSLDNIYLAIKNRVCLLFIITITLKYQVSYHLLHIFRYIF